MIHSYSINKYINGKLVYVFTHLSKNDAYKLAIPRKALLPYDGVSRWHVMMKPYAFQLMDDLLSGETIRVCWQHPPENGQGGDIEHYLIVREEVLNIQDIINNENENVNIQNIINNMNNENNQNNQNNQIEEEINYIPW